MKQRSLLDDLQVMHRSRWSLISSTTLEIRTSKACPDHALCRWNNFTVSIPLSSYVAVEPTSALGSSSCQAVRSVKCVSVQHYPAVCQGAVRTTGVAGRTVSPNDNNASQSDVIQCRTILSARLPMVCMCHCPVARCFSDLWEFYLGRVNWDLIHP